MLQKPGVKWDVSKAIKQNPGIICQPSTNTFCQGVKSWKPCWENLPSIHSGWILVSVFRWIFTPLSWLERICVHCKWEIQPPKGVFLVASPPCYSSWNEENVRWKESDTLFLHTSKKRFGKIPKVKPSTIKAFGCGDRGEWFLGSVSRYRISAASPSRNYWWLISARWQFDFTLW